MFELLSWGEYLFGLLTAAAGYYIFIALVFYRNEVLNPSGFGKKQAFAERIGRPFNKQPDIMGKAQPDIFPISKHVTIENPDQLIIAEVKPLSNDPDTAAKDALLIGFIADLLQESKTLINVIAENKPGMEQTIGMIRSLLSRYSHLSLTKFRSAINLFILDLLKDDLSIDMNPADIDQLWN